MMTEAVFGYLRTEQILLNITKAC